MTCLHALVREHADRSPNALAVVSPGGCLTYSELERQANQLACYLQSRGIGPESRVGLALPRSPELLASILGVLKAGAAWLPLDQASPQNRLAFMVQESGAALILDREHTDWDTIARQPCDPVGMEVDPDQLAYVIYTSGSTGRPKGVMVPHRGLSFYLRWCIEAYGLGPGSQVPVHSPIGFDLTVTSLLAPLAAGGTVHLVPEEAGAEGLASLLRSRRGWTLVKITPAHLELLGGLLSPEEAAGRAGLLVVGGEALYGESLAFWRQHSPGTRIVNEYGPTETVVGCCVHEVSTSDLQGAVPIGRPIPGARLLLLEEEIHIGGPGVARGYLGRPDLTAERFVPDPSPDHPGERLYRTGDLAHRRLDGELEFAGRIDRQVKLRGYRIEPGEIEEALRACPGVREAVVVPIRSGLDLQLVAYVAARPADLARPIRAELRSRLPEYMVPSRLILVPSLPRTPNGKIDRVALPAPDLSRPEERTPPRTPVEQALAALWSDLLGLPEISIEDHFFELGGHSLLATRLMARVRDELRVEISFQDVFDNPVLAGMAQAVEHAFPPLPVGGWAMGEGGQGGEGPPTFAQESLWFLERLSPGTGAYHAQSLIRFHGPLDVHLLERCLNEVVRRHEIYRSTFEDREGQPLLRVHSELHVDLPVIDLERAATLQEHLDRELAVAFDLTRLPLVRWTVVKIDADDHVLIQVEHHMLHDGWSFHLFLDELAELYGAFHAGRVPTLPDLPIRFSDFAAWQHRWIEGDEAQAQLASWRAKLAGAPPALDLPTDRPRPSVQTHRGAAPRWELPADLCRSLRTFCRREGATLFMVTLAGFLVLLERYTGQTDLCVGSAVANRRRRETETLLGMILNTVALRTGLVGNPTFRGILARVRRTTLDAYAHQDFPFEKLVEALAPERDLSRNPFFQVAFSFHDSPAPRLGAFPGLQVEVTEALGNGSSKFDLNVILIPRSEQRVGRGVNDGREGITLIWEHSTDLFDRTTIERMVDHFLGLLRTLTQHPGVHPSEASLLSEAERHQVSVEWNDTADGHGSRPVLESFHAQVSASPEALAVAQDGVRLTYAELDRQAARLAHRLRGLGVGPEERVALLTGRSIEGVIGALAVLQAGGAYVPLDPTSPPDHIDLLLRDAGVAAVLVRRDLWDRLPACAVPVLEVEISGETGLAPLPLRPSRLAYVIYTSGSTGQPKGVEVEHAGLANLVEWHQRTYALAPSDRATLIASPGFDAAVFEMWPCLAAGASLHVPDAETRSSPRKLLDWLAVERITCAFLPTPLAEAVLEEELPPGLSLRFLLTGGDRLRRVPERALPFELVNCYGPTESTVLTTTAPVSPGDAAPSIGRPIRNLRVHVVSRDGHLQPIGVPGELWIGGIGLARGYLRRPDLTAERFVPHPWGSDPGARLYRTGDLARFLPDGRIDFLGRTDRQIKVRGFRIEPGEIEAALCRHPSVLEAAVRMDRSLDLVAWVVPKPGEDIEAEGLRAFAKQQLPAFMVPSAFVALPTLPLTPNGKVDLAALPEPDERQPNLGFAPPAGLVEEAIARFWRELLGRESIGRHDNFFSLGGHSLLATRVLSRIHSAFDVELKMRELFEAEDLAEVARLVEDRIPFSP